MGRTATTLEKQKLSKKRNRIKKQKRWKENMCNKKRKNERMKRELDVSKARMHKVAPKYNPICVTRHMYAKNSKQLQ